MTRHCRNCDHEIEMHGENWEHKNHYPRTMAAMPSHPAFGIFTWLVQWWNGHGYCYCNKAEKRDDE